MGCDAGPSSIGGNIALVEVGLAVTPDEVDAALNVRVAEYLDTLIHQETVLKALERAAIRSHVGPVEVRSQSGIIGRLGECIGEVDVVKG